VSRSAPKRIPWLALVVIVLLFGAIATLQNHIDAETSDFAVQKQELLLSSPRAIEKLSLGYDSLLGDVYWTRAVQYYGSRLAEPHPNFDLLWPLLNITTTLDPKLVVAYHFGAVFLSEQVVGANRTDLAIKLVQRGIKANPDNWYLCGDLGFLYYWRMKDYPDAVSAYLEGSKLPAAPPWMKLMAARVSAMGGSIETSRMIWSEIYESTKDRNVRNMAKKELTALKAQADEEHLDEIAADYKKRFGQYPRSTEELRAAGLVRGIPLDPEGYPYIFGADGKSRLDPRSPIVMQAPASPNSSGASKR
jgi:tetratricopeptide (TPR) repeat protein